MREGMGVREESGEADEADLTVGRGEEGERGAVALSARVRLGSFWFFSEVLRELHWSLSFRKELHWSLHWPVLSPDWGGVGSDKWMLFLIFCVWE